MSQTEIRSPPIKWLPLWNYKLANLKTDFKIPEFQRRASSNHIRDIVNAILSNRFYDNVIRVVKTTKPYIVIDGQQRLQALWIVHTQNKLKTYDLQLAIYPEEFARTIYRRNNMGKPLLTRDHSKALDDKKTPFFLELKPWLDHEKTPTKQSYPEMLHALHYAKGARNIVQIRELDSVVTAITKSDIEAMKVFCQAMQVHAPIVFKALAYRVAIYRNVFRIGYDKKFNQRQYMDLLTAATTNKKILEITQGRKHADIMMAYKVMIDEIVPRIK